MIDSNTVKQVEQSSVAERIRFIEIILQSLRNDIKEKPKEKSKKSKAFKVRTFDLGEDVHVDRDELYSERG